MVRLPTTSLLSVPVHFEAATAWHRYSGRDLHVIYQRREMQLGKGVLRGEKGRRRRAAVFTPDLRQRGRGQGGKLTVNNERFRFVLSKQK